MTNEELQEQLAGAQFAAAQHLKTVQQQAKIINGMDPRPIPASHRLLPVALHPAIEEALKRYTWMPESAWQDVIAAANRVNRDAVDADWLMCERICNEDHVDQALTNFGHDTTHDNAVGIIQAAITVYRADTAPLAAPERSGKTADEADLLRDILDLAECGMSYGLTADDYCSQIVTKIKVAIPAPCTNSDSWNCKYCRKSNDCEALGDKRNFGRPVAVGSSAAPSEAMPEHLREFVEAIAYTYDRADGDDESVCLGCSGLIEHDAGANKEYAHHRPDCIVLRAQAALATPSVQAVAAGQVPAGYALVPLKPTEEMQRAYFQVIDKNMYRVQTDATFGRYSNMSVAYAAMVAAAPKPPALAGDTQAGE